MSPSLLPGDFILVNKWSYGARIFTGLDFGRYDPSMIRLPGTGNIKRNDVVVFNFPYRKGRDTIRMNLDRLFVKRCIGLPGDSLSIRNGYYHISGLSAHTGYLPGQEELSLYRGGFAPAVYRTFPKDSLLNWNILDFGPLYIPCAGDILQLTPMNYLLYKKQIMYETGSSVTMIDSMVYVDDVPLRHYIFINNWYFMAGDYALNSQDSRYIGLIPENYIIGKASVVLSSNDPGSGKKRWKRIFKPIK
jgi:signal peptidase I